MQSSSRAAREGAIQLTTERLQLRELEEGDWPAVLAYQEDPLYLRYYERTERTPAAVQEFVRMQVALQHPRPRIKYQVGVVLRSSGQLIGNCGVRMASSDAHEADIGYELSPKQWGKGYATEAASAIVDFGFTELHLHRVWAWCVADNLGSARVLEKIGMRPEGRLRDKEHFKDRWWDRLLFGMLEDEWRAQRQVRAAGKHG